MSLGIGDLRRVDSVRPSRHGPDWVKAEAAARFLVRKVVHRFLAVEWSS